MKFLFLTMVILIGNVGCGGNSESINIHGVSSVLDEIDLTDVKAYSKNSRYASILTDCIADIYAEHSCSLAQLPFIGMEEGEVTDAYIEERLLVSHTWMGDRFMAALQQYPEEAKQLFGSVTAIVIDADIRPSFYLEESGAIYLDPDNFWLTIEEKRTLSVQEDYRSNFGDELSLIVASRSVKNDDYAYEFYDLEDDSERSLDDIIYPLMGLLFHELVHANDFFPAAKMTNVNLENTAFEAINASDNDMLSDKLYLDSALTSTKLTGLAEVLYKGFLAADFQLEFTADDVGALFANDSANHMYNYANQHEDLAMLVEAVLMKRYFDVDWDIAFLHRPEFESNSCRDYIVGWGERNRIANPLVKNRAQLAMQLVIPEVDWDGFFAGDIGQYSRMISGNNWCENLSLSANVIDVEGRSVGVGVEMIRGDDFLGHQLH